MDFPFILAYVASSVVSSASIHLNKPFLLFSLQCKLPSRHCLVCSDTIEFCMTLLLFLLLFLHPKLVICNLHWLKYLILFAKEKLSIWCLSQTILPCQSSQPQPTSLPYSKSRRLSPPICARHQQGKKGTQCIAAPLVSSMGAKSKHHTPKNNKAAAGYSWPGHTMYKSG